MGVAKPKISPCTDCEERKPGCHGTCEKYKEWRVGVDAYSKAKRENFKESVYEYYGDLNKRIGRAKEK